jgi:Protein of unknown function (DUF3775)
VDVRQYHTADYLLGTPLLADFLEEGLAQFGLSCAEFQWAGCRVRPSLGPKAARESATGQCAIRTGRVMLSRIVRVAPPSTSSRTRECA